MRYFIRLIFAVILLISSIGANAQLSLKIETADGLYKTAVKQAKAGNLKAAIKILNHVLDLKPNYVDAKVLLAKYYLQTHNYAACIIQADEAMKISPKYQDVYFYIINAYLSTRRPATALEYTQRALGLFPSNNDLKIKQISILDQLRRYPQADDSAENLYRQSSNSEQIRKIYMNHYQNEGDYFASVNNPGMAKINYNKALIVDPQNASLLNSLMKLDARNDDYEAALTRINASLSKNERSYYLLMRKLGVLQDMKRYADALDVLNKVLKYYPGNAKARKLNVELREEAASYYINTNSQDIYQSIFDKNPGNRVALNKVIGLALSHDAHRQALYYINLGLKAQPADFDLLTKKLDIEVYDRNYPDAAEIALALYRRRPSQDLKLQVQELKSASGRYYLGQQQPEIAIPEFNDALSINPANATALNGKISALLQQNDREQALKVISGALKLYPGNKKLLILKSSVLADAGDLEAAAEFTTAIRLELPKSKQVNHMFTDQHLAVVRMALENENYTTAKKNLDLILEDEPGNKAALNYMVNLLYATEKYQDALFYTRQALHYFPEDKDFLLKQSSILYDIGRFNEAAQVGQVLYERYPYNKKYKTAYTDALLLSGKDMEKRHIQDSALYVYSKILIVKPQDSLATLYALNLLIAKKQFAQAYALVNTSLEKRPENEGLLFRKSEILEKQQDITHAAQVADSLQELYPKKNYIEYYEELKKRLLKNQFGLYYFHTRYETTTANSIIAPSYNIATVEYRHYFDKGSFATRFNFAGRQQGTGIQGEAELYYKHTTSLYSYAVAGVSNDIVLPRIKLNYSIFKTFKPEIEAELGVKYLEIQTFRSVSIVASLAKTFGDFWFNIRGYGIHENADYYTAFNLTSRYSLNKGRDFISLAGAVGTSPDDRSRLILFPHLSGLLSRSIGAGYQRTINYRTLVGINCTYINQKISPTAFQNQTDLYLSLQRRF